jgi:hypothetical protein
VDLGQIFASALSSIIGVCLAGAFVHWQHKRAERNAANGRPITVSGSIRRVERTRLGSLWRHGSVNIDGDQIFWTPRTPWGRTVVIGSVRYGLRQAPVGLLRWQLPPAAVVVPCSDAERSYELAVLPGSVKYFLRAQFAA